MPYPRVENSLPTTTDTSGNFAGQGDFPSFLPPPFGLSFRLNILLEPAMKCPVCPNSALVMSDRQGIEIDYCPTCRGVWLDRGELDKIIERSAQSAAEPAASQRHIPQPAPQPAPHYPPQHHGYHSKPQYHKHKSWLSELFD